MGDGMQTIGSPLLPQQFGQVLSPDYPTRTSRMRHPCSFVLSHQKGTCIRFRISSKLGSFSALTFPWRTKKSRRTIESSAVGSKILQASQRDVPSAQFGLKSPASIFSLTE